PDNPDGKVRNIVLPDANALTAEFRPDLLRGVEVIKGRAVGLAMNEDGSLKRTDQPFMAIPYSTWANRGRGQMIVWLARTDGAARPTPYPTVATTATMTASPVPNGRGKNPRNMIDGDEPASSSDSSAYFDWWPLVGRRNPGGQAPPDAIAWVEMTFAKPSTVRESRIYWFDDTGRGGVRVPASWRLLYKDGSEWKPVTTTDPLGTARDAWNAVTFSPITTSALRIEVVMQEGFSAGVQEWTVK